MAKSKFGIVWTRRANLELRRIRESIIEEFSIQRANKYINGLIEKIELTQNNSEYYPPCRNRKLKKAGARFFVYKKQYKIIYALRKGNIFVISISGAKRNPENLDRLL